MPAAWEFAKSFDKNWRDYDTLLNPENIIWKERTMGVGTMSAADALDWGLVRPHGPGLRWDWDLRRDNPYSELREFEFEVPLGTREGDTYSRFLVRMQDMFEQPHRQAGVGEDRRDRARGHQVRRPPGEPAAQGDGL